MSNQAWYHFSVNGETARLRVLAGDGIGVDILREQARGQNLPFPFWLVSSGLGRAPTLNSRSSDLDQAPCEIVAAVVFCVDHVADESSFDLVSALKTLNLPADSSSSMGRSISFDSSGERLGPLGLVLEAQPGNDVPIVSYRLDSAGEWVEDALPEKEEKGSR